MPVTKRSKRWAYGATVDRMRPGGHSSQREAGAAGPSLAYRVVACGQVHPWLMVSNDFSAAGQSRGAMQAASAVWRRRDRHLREGRSRVRLEWTVRRKCTPAQVHGEAWSTVWWSTRARDLVRVRVRVGVRVRVRVRVRVARGSRRGSLPAGSPSRQARSAPHGGTCRGIGRAWGLALPTAASARPRLAQMPYRGPPAGRRASRVAADAKRRRRRTR